MPTRCAAFPWKRIAGSVVLLPPIGYRRDNPDLVQASVEPIYQIGPVPDKPEVPIPGAQILIGRPGDDPHQLVLVHTRDGQENRVRAHRAVRLVVACQLSLNDLDCGFSIDHACSIAYGLAW